jgi:hypothetical protein
MKSTCLLRTAVNCPVSLQGAWKLNGTLTAIILQDEEEEVTPEEKKAIFYAAAELEVRYHFLNP